MKGEMLLSGTCLAEHALDGRYGGPPRRRSIMISRAWVGTGEASVTAVLAPLPEGRAAESAIWTPPPRRARSRRRPGLWGRFPAPTDLTAVAPPTVAAPARAMRSSHHRPRPSDHLACPLLDFLPTSNAVLLPKELGDERERIDRGLICVCPSGASFGSVVQFNSATG